MEDPLDIIDFDPVQFINNKYPTEASLEDLDSFVLSIGKQINALDGDISKAVQSQSIAGQQASTDIEDAQLSIQELFIKINDIKSKAAQSEQMVQEICADIKKLDYAKTHLQTSITSLKRLQMLITAVGQLELLAQEYQYRYYQSINLSFLYIKICISNVIY
jgi:chromosome segregation ATPase